MDDVLPDLSAFLAASRRPLLVVLGPTASGKTALSVDLALWLTAGGRPAEVINADSRQLYRLLDIGTAKVTEEERRGVPHHLFSVLNPSEEVTIAEYQRLAEAAIAEARSRGAIPILVGGSMLYISAVIDGLQPLPKADPAVRARLEAEYDADDGVTLFARLEELDPEAAIGIARQNKPYVVRALEIAETLGTRASVAKTTVDIDHDLFLIGLRRSREDTVARIHARTPLLLAGGWVEEVAALLDAGYDETAPGMKSHGYREVIAALRRHGYPSAAAIEAARNDAALREAIDAKTRQYAKRQMTWWKDDPRIHWIDR